jgi:hypothetical protein
MCTKSGRVINRLHPTILASAGEGNVSAECIGRQDHWHCRGAFPVTATWLVVP